MTNQLAMSPAATQDICATMQIEKNLVLASALWFVPVDVDSGYLRRFNVDTDRSHEQGLRDGFEVFSCSFDRHIRHVEFLHVTAGQPANKFCAAAYRHGVTVTESQTGIEEGIR